MNYTSINPNEGNRLLCPVCNYPVPGWRIVHRFGEVFCSWRCSNGYIGMGEAVTAIEALPDMPERDELRRMGCLCEPCPVDLKTVFPKAKIFYESPEFAGTKCGWHWEVRGTIRGRSGPIQTSVCVSSKDTLYVTFENRIRGAVDHSVVGAAECPKSSWPVLRQSVKWKRK